METSKSFQERANQVYSETMERLSLCRHEQRAYVSMLVRQAYLNGLQTGYWKGMDDAKFVSRIDHWKKCRDDFHYWFAWNCILKKHEHDTH